MGADGAEEGGDRGEKRLAHPDDLRTLEAYLHDHIPLSAAMGVRAVGYDARRVELTAPIEPNLNHRGTAFGGSVGALAILAGWTHVHFRAAAEGKAVRTVIQRSAVEYVAPAEGELVATCEGVHEEAWRRFRRAFDRYGKGRVAADAVVTCEGVTVATFTGAYVVIAR